MNAQIVTDGKTGWLQIDGEKIDNIALTNIEAEPVKPDIINFEKHNYMAIMQPIVFKISGILENKSCF